jgi:hypothetical protein
MPSPRPTTPAEANPWQRLYRDSALEVVGEPPVRGMPERSFSPIRCRGQDKGAACPLAVPGPRLSVAWASVPE